MGVMLVRGTRARLEKENEKVAHCRRRVRLVRVSRGGQEGKRKSGSLQESEVRQSLAWGTRSRDEGSQQNRSERGGISSRKRRALRLASPRHGEEDRLVLVFMLWRIGSRGGARHRPSTVGLNRVGAAKKPRAKPLGERDGTIPQSSGVGKTINGRS